METITHWITHYGYLGLFVLLMLGIVGLPVPDETLMAFTGFAVHEGKMRFWAALGTAFAGSACGITLSYALGYFLGAWLIRRYGPWVHLTPQRLDRVHGWFEAYGRWTLTFGYFIPGFRHVTAYAAGMTRMRYWIFAVFAYAGALLWAATFLTAGYQLGPAWQKAARWAAHGHRILLYILAGAVALLVLVWVRRAAGGRRSS